MQLKSLAKTQDALNSIRNLGVATEELSSIGRKYSLETLKSAIAQSTLNKEQIKTILSANELQGELLETTADELANAASTNMVATSQAASTGTTLGLGTAFKGLGIAIKKVTADMIAWMVTNPVGWITAVVTAIGAITYGVIKLHDATIPLEKQKKKLQETKDAYEDVKGELQEVKTEIQNNIDKIQELEALSNPSWADQEELDRLKEVNKELAKQKELKKDEKLQAAEDLYQKNKKTFDTEFESSYGTTSVEDLKQQLSLGNIGIGQLDFENNITDAISALQYLEEEKKKLTDKDEIEEYNSSIEALSNSIKANGKDYLSSISEYKQNILEIASERNLTKDEQSFYDYLTSMQKMIYEFYSPATWNNLEFESIFDTEGLEKTKEELIELAKAGKLSPEILKGYPKLNNAIKQSAIIAGEGSDAFKEFYDQIMALAYPNNLNYDEVRRQLFESSGIGYGRISGESDAKIAQRLERSGLLSNEGLEAYVSVRAKYDISDFNVDDLIYYIQKELNEKSGTLAFNDIFAFKNADGTLTTLGKISESIDTIQKAYNTLSSAIDEYNNNGVISIDTLQSVMELGDDWLDYLVAEDGALKLDKESLDDLAKSRLEEMRIRTLNNLIGKIAQIEDETKANEYLISTNYAASESFEELARTSALATAELLKTKVASGDLSQGSYDAVIEKMYSDINKINTLFDNASADLSYNASSSASSAAKSFTDLLDKELNVLDKKMEAGYIDFNDYIKSRLDLIEDYYRQGKLAADEYYSYLEKHYNQELSYRDKVIKAVTRRIDNEIDDLEKQKDDIESYYKVQIDALNKKKTLLENANKERQREIDLQKAMYDLERARNQRTKLIYSEDKGMHYVADDSAIKDASQEVENAEFEVKIAEIEKAITKLEEARDAETDAIDDMIDKLKEYRDQWNDITSAYEETQEDLLAAQMLGQDWEKDIIDTRLDTLNKFKDDYIAIQQAMVDAAYQAAQAMEKQEPIKIGDSSERQYEVVDEANPMSDGKKFSTKKEADEYAEKQNKNRAEENGMTLDQFNNSDIPGYFVYKKKYHTGLKQGRIGQHSFDEDFKLVQKVGLGDKDVPAILKEGEAVATPEQISNIADGIRSNATPYDPDEDDSAFGKLYKAWHAHNDTNTNPIEEMSRHILTDHTKQMNEVVNRITNATNIMNHRNAQPVVNQTITLNCPNLTNNSGIEYVQRELGHLSQMALQEPLRKY